MSFTSDESQTSDSGLKMNQESLVYHTHTHSLSHISMALILVSLTLPLHQRTSSDFSGVTLDWGQSKKRIRM